MKLTDDLKWRYATKKFDPERKVSAEKMADICEAIQLAPSSLGLQPVKVLHIRNESIRKHLREVSWGQSALTDASDILVFCNMDTLSDSYLEYIAEMQRSQRDGTPESKEGYLSFVKGYLAGLTPEQIRQMTGKECYLTAGVAMCACAELHVDSCPIGGFEPQAYERILNLTEKGLHPELVLAIGYRASDDAYQYAVKVRKPMNDLFEEI